MPEDFFKYLENTDTRILQTLQYLKSLDQEHT